MLIDMSELPELLRAHIAILRGLVRSALDDFNRDHQSLRVRYTARSEASIIHDNMVWHAKHSSFPWKIKRNLFLFRIGDDFAVKLKKLDTFLRPRNIPTQLVLHFDGQRAMRLFDDLDLTHLFLGYQREGAELAASPIWLVCPDGRGIKWAAELRAEDGSASVQFAVPATPTLPTVSVGRRVKAKLVTQQKVEKAGE